MDTIEINSLEELKKLFEEEAIKILNEAGGRLFLLPREGSNINKTIKIFTGRINKLQRDLLKSAKKYMLQDKEVSRMLYESAKTLNFLKNELKQIKTKYKEREIAKEKALAREKELEIARNPNIEKQIPTRLKVAAQKALGKWKKGNEKQLGNLNKIKRSALDEFFEKEIERVLGEYVQTNKQNK